MYNTLFTNCDGCGKTLEGQQGTHTYREPYLQIKGQIAQISYDKDGKKDSTYCTPSDLPYLHFCNERCLRTYCSARVAMRQNRTRNQEWDWGIMAKPIRI